MFREEKGFEVITPFYTHLDQNGKPVGIFVNRGWLPKDLARSRLHYFANNNEVRGYLSRDYGENKYSKPNNPTVDDFHTVRLKDFSLIS